MSRLVVASLVVALVPCLVPCLVRAEDESLKIGDFVESFELRDIKGKTHKLDVDARTKAIVLAFNGVGCPIAELYSERLQKISEDYSEHGVQVLGINSNAHDKVEELRSFANRHGITFPILKDHDHAIADVLGARRTTEVFLLDAKRRLVYRGRVDDQYAITDRSVGLRKDRPEVHHLRAAIDDVLAGKDVRVPSTPALGCVIGRKPKVVDAKSITFHRDVEPIVQKRCQPCHREGEIGPFPLISYDDVSGWSGMIHEVVDNRRMPPWHADSRHGKFSNDRSLSRKERDTILKWIDNGAPAGDVADSPPPMTFTSGWAIGKPDAVFDIGRDFDVPASGTVRYQYFMTKTDFAEDRWVRAAEIRATNREVVHHLLIFAIDPKNPRKWRRETGGGTSGYFAAMVPGEQPIVYPKGMAKRLPAGATLVFQVHYTPNGKKTLDRSKIGLIFADKDEIRHEVRTTSAFSQWIRIPENTARHVELAKKTLRKDIRVLAFLPHMHIRGEAFQYDALVPASVKLTKEPDWDQLTRDEMRTLGWSSSKSELTSTGSIDAEVSRKLEKMYAGNTDDVTALAKLRKEARTETLLSVPRYDFGWQSSYRLEKPLDLRAGTVILCRAVFNNSASNPALTKNMWSRRVRWGDQTWDEMLIGYLDYVETAK